MSRIEKIVADHVGVDDGNWVSVDRRDLFDLVQSTIDECISIVSGCCASGDVSDRAMAMRRLRDDLRKHWSE
jgi:hypothetical protein